MNSPAPPDTRFLRRRLIDQMAMREAFKFYLQHDCGDRSPVLLQIREIIEEAVTEIDELVKIRKRDPEERILDVWRERESGG
jgi:hypothetical protein